MESIAAETTSESDFSAPAADSAPKERVTSRDFGTTGKPCRRDVPVLDVPEPNVGGRPYACPRYPGALEGDASSRVKLWSLPRGGEYTRLAVDRPRRRCRACGWSGSVECGFKVADHMLTPPPLRFVEGLLEMGQTLKAASPMTDLGKNVVREVDKAEQRRVAEAGDKEAASALKNSKRILMAKRLTLRSARHAPKAPGTCEGALFARPGCEGRRQHDQDAEPSGLRPPRQRLLLPEDIRREPALRAEPRVPRGVTTPQISGLSLILCMGLLFLDSVVWYVPHF